ncbi:MAG: tripartite tricarboxylate transporter TctB family protein [Hyphomicrobiaceae bacterium]
MRQWQVWGAYNFNTIAAVVFLALAVGLYLSIPYQIDKPLFQIGAASQSNLSAELFPTIVAVSMFVLGIWYLWLSPKLKETNDLATLDREAITNVTVTLVLMAIYVPLMVNLGFVVGSAIVIFAMSTYFGNRNFGLGAAVSIVVPMAMFFVFRRLLLTELPPFPIDIYPLTHWSLI